MCTQWTLNYPMRQCGRSSRFQWVLDAFITRRLEKIKIVGSDRGLDFFAFIQVTWKAVCVLFYSVIYSSHVVNSLVILQSVWFNKKLSQEVFLKTLITPYVCCFPTQWLLNEENKKQLWLQGDPELLPQAFQSTTAATANQFNPSKSMQKRRET